MSNRYATSREELVEGSAIPHVTTGGMWRVLRVNDDGSIFARSDMGAQRTVKTEHVDAGLDYARYLANREG